MLPDILDKIVAAKREALAVAKAALPQSELVRRCADLPPTRGFADALDAPGIRVIAESKKASPSKGLIAPDYDPARNVRRYEALGAAACSVLTEERFFQGALADLRAARAATALPLLRKDFIFDAYQLFEARAAGADAVLLIAAMLPNAQLADLTAQAHALGLDVLGEAHDAEEVDRLVALGLRVIGVNARDLRTFRTDLSAVHGLLARIPADRIAVAESAITSKADLETVGARRCLVGEALMRDPDLLPRLLK